MWSVKFFSSAGECGLARSSPWSWAKFAGGIEVVAEALGSTDYEQSVIAKRQAGPERASELGWDA